MLCYRNIKKRVFIWGTTIKALKFYCKHKIDSIEICGFIDNNAVDSMFLGKTIYKESEIEFSNSYIVFCGTENTYYSYVKPFLEGQSMCEFGDFVFSDFLEKRIVLVHGNCHTNSVMYLLKSSDIFNEKFVIYKNKRICEYTVDEVVPANVLKNIDIFIHQDIRIENGYGYNMSDACILPQISKNCMNITIPNLYKMGIGFFPQASGVNTNNMYLNGGRDTNGLFPYADEFIDSLLKVGKTEKEIIQICKKEDLLLSEDIVNRFNDVVFKLKKREENWSIKISDFIIENYKKTKLFYDIGHPTENMMVYIVNQILRMIGINDEIGYVYGCDRMDTHEMPIYPCVKKALNIEYDTTCIREYNSDSKKLFNKMDIDEYISEYILWRKYSKGEIEL